MTIPFRIGNGFSEQANNPASLHVPMVYEQMPLKPVQWEYHVFAVDTREMDIPGTTQLNELGTQGWLLVGILDQRGSGSASREEGQMTRDYVSRVVERESQRASSLVYYYFVRQKSE